MYEKLKKFYLNSIPLILISNKKLHNKFIKITHHKNKQKLLTKSQKENFWKTSVKDFFDLKLDGNVLSNISNSKVMNIECLIKKNSEALVARDKLLGILTTTENLIEFSNASSGINNNNSIR